MDFKVLKEIEDWKVNFKEIKVMKVLLLMTAFKALQVQKEL